MNFTRAAKRLGVTQPGLSRRVASLEKRYRITPFERDLAKLVLTEAGHSWNKQSFRS
ncbi:helix-turn-helix domain-containing protein [Tunturiibacter psychrotolerans]